VRIIWTRHAQERQREWEKKLTITRQEVEMLLHDPEQVIPGDRGTLIAQRRRSGGLIRAPFIELGADRKILTVYWTSRIDRYWRKERDADQV